MAGPQTGRGLMASRDTMSGTVRRGWSSLLGGVSTGEESQGQEKLLLC